MSRTPKTVQKMKTLILPKGLTLKVKKVRSPSSEVKSRRNKLKTQLIEAAAEVSVFLINAESMKLYDSFDNKSLYVIE